jgi:hypothetical protein
MSDMKHAKIKTTTINLDGSTNIETKSYFEELASVKEETQKTTWTDDTNLLADSIKCLDVITKHISEEVSINIKREKGKIVIVKTWTIRKESYKK